MPGALFGIDNGGVNLVVNLFVLTLIVTWVALIAWTYLDARRRLDDGVLIACSVAASLFPFVGTAVYAILRPPEFLEDARERELETRAAELRLRQLEEQTCPSCEFPIERNYLRCPNCRSRIKDPCESCGRPVDPRWSICPYCENPMRQQRRPRRGARQGARERSGPERVEDEGTERSARPQRQQPGRADGAGKGSSGKGTGRTKQAGRGGSPKKRSVREQREAEREAERERIAASRRSRG